MDKIPKDFTSIKDTYYAALINNMDHMRILGTEPSSVILSQNMKFKKLKSIDPKMPKQAKAKGNGVII